MEVEKEPFMHPSRVDRNLAIAKALRELAMNSHGLSDEQLRDLCSTAWPNIHHLSVGEDISPAESRQFSASRSAVRDASDGKPNPRGGVQELPRIAAMLERRVRNAAAAPPPEVTQTQGGVGSLASLSVPMRSTGMRTKRQRGIAWVCDVAGSSKRMNSKSEVADLENFLQRMFWTTRGLCRPYGADFFKWTGDGFVAWFPVELDRERGEIATAAIDAASHLSSLIYATQLALKPATPFQIRHGMAYEKGGLVFEITTPEGEVERDLLGRDIVLAFRLSGVASPFPFICAHRDVALDSNPNATFRALTLTDEEITKYMKGERYGCDALYQTIDDRGVELSKEKLEQIRGGILRAKERMEAGDQPDPKDPYNQWCEYMQSSGAPNWSKEIMRKYDDSLREVTTRLMGEV